MANVSGEGPPRPRDIMNILIASDIHLGFTEKDPVRGEDSFTTFEEILCIAKEKNVDFILLGGDLFHDSKPTPKCIHRCMSLLRKYCMGNRPVAVEFLSDQSENFKHCVKPIVNYEDPNLNISIPVFSIHGNHDDPSGYGRVSSLDLLSASGLVNYFGKWTDLTTVKISPLLMRKGSTQLALYGLSYLKDERLVRLFETRNVTMLRPKEDTEDWCNVFVLHQNRMDRGPRNFVSENMLPDLFDLVIWGHEHECRIQPEYNELRKFFVCQPGSPVATSLSEGEAVQKHVALLNIHKKKFKVTPIPLKTVRPFVFDTISLADCTIDLVGDKPAEQVQMYVSNHLETMIEQAAQQISGDNRQPELPLIRLRVEYADERHMFNAVRFGLQYADRIANPSEVVLFRKLRNTDKIKSENKVDKEALESLFSGDHPGPSGNRVEKVVERYFEEVAKDKNLQILSIKGLAEAASRYVDKDDKEALMILVDHQMEQTMKHLLSKKDLTEADIEKEIENFRLERVAKSDEEVKSARALLENPMRHKEVKKQSSNHNIIDSDSDDVTEELEIPVVTSSRGRGRGRASSTRARGSSSRGARGRGKVEPLVQANIKDIFNQSREKRPSRAASSKQSVIYDDDSD